jgi:hypothetical protein
MVCQRFKSQRMDQEINTVHIYACRLTMLQKEKCRICSWFTKGGGDGNLTCSIGIHVCSGEGRGVDCCPACGGLRQETLYHHI